MFKVIWFILQALVTIPMLPRDARFGIKFLAFTRQMDQWKQQSVTIHKLFDQNVEKNPDKIAVRYINDNSAYTFKELRDYSLRISNYFLKNNYKQGDIVALYMDNYPSYIAVYMGLSRIGVITALVNNSAKGNILIHAITKAAKSVKGLIVGTLGEGHLIKELDEANNASQEKLPAGLNMFTLGKDTLPTTSLTFVNLDDQLNGDDLLKPLEASVTKNINMKTHMLYVFTSGTEGLPKAAIIDIQRFMFLSSAIHTLLAFREKDIVYTPMPLYHVAGGLVGTGQMLMFGNTMIIRDKFSASAYFDDCAKNQVTVAQYIGEMCTYVYARKPSKDDKKHKVRMMVGNGMRKLIWKKFKRRFRIKKIGEFYGSTEGNANMVNINNKVGAVGFLPWYIRKILYPIELIEYDPNLYIPKRNPKTGLCIRATNEGLLISKINKVDQNNGKGQNTLSEFVGYTDEKSTESKIIRNVFVQGDAYVNLGDVLSRDVFSYYYFVDRLGDTFRWKGENVAASQIEEIIVRDQEIPASKVLVYGVQVKDKEGRAGMAAFEIKYDEFDMKKFMNLVSKNFDAPRKPVFLRFTTTFPATTTAKLQKGKLKTDGFDPAKMPAGDKLLFLNPDTRKYEELTSEKYDLIQGNKQKI